MNKYVQPIIEDSVADAKGLAEFCIKLRGFDKDSAVAKEQIELSEEEIVKNKKIIEKTNSSTDQELINTFLENVHAGLKKDKEKIQNIKKHRNTAERILEELSKWECGTDFLEFKLFLIKQLKSSIERDLNPTAIQDAIISREEIINNPICDNDIRNKTLRTCEENIEFHKKSIQRYKDSIEWTRNLRKSVELWQS